MVDRDFYFKVLERMEALPMRQYYPYGPKVEFEYWTTGKVDLREVWKEPHNEGKTAKDYLLEIYSGIGGAMNYLAMETRQDYQNMEALALFILFDRGDMGWTKEPLVGLTEEEGTALILKHKARYELSMKRQFSDDRQREYDAQVDLERTPEKRLEYAAAMAKSAQRNREENGIYEVRVLPLMNRDREALYTIPELAAIDLMVGCEFENLC